MLVKALKLQGANSSLDFADAGSIQTWAKPYIAQALESGLISGYADGTFRPKGSVSRAELGALLRGRGSNPGMGEAVRGSSPGGGSDEQSRGQPVRAGRLGDES